jgi:hypothetical protein
VRRSSDDGDGLGGVVRIEVERDRGVRILGLPRSLHHESRLLATFLQRVLESEGDARQDAA